MKRTVFAALIALSTFASFAQAQEVKIGDETSTSDEVRISLRIQSPAPKLYFGTWQYADECFSDFDRKMAAIGFSDERVLVLYKTENMDFVWSCPNNAIGFVTKKAFLTSQEMYERQVAEGKRKAEQKKDAESERGLVEQILKQYSGEK